MLSRIFGLATGSWWGLAGTAAVGAAAGVALTVAADNAFVHGPEIQRLNDQHTADAKLNGALQGALALSNAAVEIERNLRKNLGAHEARAAGETARACSADVETALQRGIAIGKAVCRARTPQ